MSGVKVLLSIIAIAIIGAAAYLVYRDIMTSESESFGNPPENKEDYASPDMDEMFQDDEDAYERESGMPPKVAMAEVERAPNAKSLEQYEDYSDETGGGDASRGDVLSYQMGSVPESEYNCRNASAFDSKAFLPQGESTTFDETNPYKGDGIDGYYKSIENTLRIGAVSSVHKNANLSIRADPPVGENQTNMAIGTLQINQSSIRVDDAANRDRLDDGGVAI